MRYLGDIPSVVCNFKLATTPWGGGRKGKAMAIIKQYSFSSIDELDMHIIDVCNVMGNVPMITYTNEVVPYLSKLIDMRVRMVAHTYVVVSVCDVIDITTRKVSA